MVVMIAFVVISPQEGISKKILCQACALSQVRRSCVLYCLNKDNNLQKIECVDGKMKSCIMIRELNINMRSLFRVSPFIQAIEKDIAIRKNDDLYVRHMVPSFAYLGFLKRITAKRKFVEIPTYPYFYEQLSTAPNKVLTGLRIIYESAFWPLIYKAVDEIVAIPCRTWAHKFKKMRYITNGFCRPDDLTYAGKKDNDNSLTLLGVGTIQYYHGYEKIIEGIHAYKGELNIKFIVVGNGATDYLKKLTDRYKLQNKIIFTGLKTGDELETLYKEADIGVGTMALELRKADIDTGIKILDYYSRGMPVISSGICPEIVGLGRETCKRIDSDIDFDELYTWEKSFSEEDKNRMCQITAREYSWERIMEKIFDE